MQLHASVGDRRFLITRDSDADGFAVGKTIFLQTA
jgi:hypothetical protein